mmetsp:Transcript_45088/g.82423  ORF Transcript_45088/g.82423 Transcript_45088/m.82423 type:complete len:229 (-) Transcript_45088:310-996(-)
MRDADRCDWRPARPEGLVTTPWADGLVTTSAGPSSPVSILTLFTLLEFSGVLAAGPCSSSPRADASTDALLLPLLPLLLVGSTSSATLCLPLLTSVLWDGSSASSVTIHCLSCTSFGVNTFSRNEQLPLSLRKRLPSTSMRDTSCWVLAATNLSIGMLWVVRKSGLLLGQQRLSQNFQQHSFLKHLQQRRNSSFCGSLANSECTARAVKAATSSSVHKGCMLRTSCCI